MCSHSFSLAVRWFTEILPSKGMGAMTEWSDIVRLVVEKHDLKLKQDTTAT